MKVILIMIRKMEKERKLKLMEAHITVGLLMARKMEKGRIMVLTEQNIVVIGNWTKYLDWELISGPTTGNMSENGKIIQCTV